MPEGRDPRVKGDFEGAIDLLQVSNSIGRNPCMIPLETRCNMFCFPAGKLTVRMTTRGSGRASDPLWL
jgi:hypothetical protein